MILTATQIRESEKMTMEREPISSIDLMERAGTVFTQKLLHDFTLTGNTPAVIFCGPGNNGGDGLVIARLLAQKGIPTEVVLCTFGKKTTEEFDTNLQRFKEIESETDKVRPFEEISGLCSDYSRALCIDAIFGIGLARPIEGEFAEAIHYINENFDTVVAVDTPSGMFIDTPLPYGAACVKATDTYTFQFPKWEFLRPANRAFVGEVSVLDIGLMTPPSAEGTKSIGEEDVKIINNETIIDYLPLLEVSPNAHKGTFGHALLLAGSQRMPGAAIMSATAALRGGCGKLTVHTTSNVALALPIALPEAIISTDVNEEAISCCHWEDIDGLNAVAIGPGIGQSQKTKGLLKALLSEIRSPVIFDADALNLLAADKTLLAYLPPRSVLTPHQKEFERLAGACATDTERVLKLRNFVDKHQVTVILKGHNSIVAIPRREGSCRLFIVSTGNPGMATAGSGDVLTGLLLGLMARTQRPEAAAIIATYIHGLAGDIALESESVESLIATDIIKNMGKAFNKAKITH
ncbi:MAG: NAD(P)H-hydrate dehydratase [Bacteroidales bacterium]|nr:NAD(P)H-hydrate dehydratase [Bacteroidales bacterium]